MNFEIGYGFQYVPKIRAFDPNKLFFVQTISYDLKVRLFLTLSESFGITLRHFAMGDPVQHSVDTKKKAHKKH